MGYERDADTEVMRDGGIMLVKITVTGVLAATEIASRSNARFIALTLIVTACCGWSVGAGERVVDLRAQKLSVRIGRRACESATE